MLAEDVLAAVRNSYGDLEDPRLHFVAERARERPFEGLVVELTEGHGFAVEETSDLNDDVCFGYSVTKDGAGWALDLSLVGPFAVLARVADSTWSVVLTDKTTDLTDAESVLVAAVGRAGLRLLPVEELEAPVELRLDDLDAEDVHVYQALFSRTDFFPWEVF